jgi:4-amino-4-deoxy-L-arabinose transferase-like glycosyltransferase
VLEAFPRGRKAAGPAVLVAGLLLAIIVINPFREMLSEGDAFAYARSVQHLLATGKYRLDSWSAANMPVQIYLAAGLSKLIGYSLSLLRCTTLALLAVGLGSFYALLRETSQKSDEASVLTLGLLANPLVLMLAFTFMSDVQFLGWFLLSLWLYVRGMRNKSAGIMFLGSLASGCAIGTRQFGIAMIGGLVLSWLLSRRENRPPIRIMLAALVIPVLAAGAQMYVGFRAPNFTQAFRLTEEHHYLARPALALLKEAFWRCIIISQYIGMSVLTVLPLVLIPGKSTPKKRPGGRRLISIMTILFSAAMIAGLSMTSLLTQTARPAARHGVLWQPLQLYWLLPTQLYPMPLVMRILDFCGIVGASTLVWTGLRCLQRLRASRQVSSTATFLAGTCTGLLILHLTYTQLNDTYIVAFIPFGVLIIAERLRGYEPRRVALALSSTLSIMLILLASLWIRGEYARQQADFKAADVLADAGVQPGNIYGSAQWAAYHGAFDAWIAAGAPGFGIWPKGNPSGYDWLHDPFNAWLQERGEKADYRIVNSREGPPPPRWQIVATRSYRSARFEKRFVWTLTRAPTP